MLLPPNTTRTKKNTRTHNIPEAPNNNMGEKTKSNETHLAIIVVTQMSTTPTTSFLAHVALSHLYFIGFAVRGGAGPAHLGLAKRRTGTTTTTKTGKRQQEKKQKKEGPRTRDNRGGSAGKINQSALLLRPRRPRGSRKGV